MVIDGLGNFSSDIQSKNKENTQSDESIDPQDLEDAVVGMSIGTSQIAAVLTQKHVQVENLDKSQSKKQNFKFNHKNLSTQNDNVEEEIDDSSQGTDPEMINMLS